MYLRVGSLFFSGCGGDILFVKEYDAESHNRTMEVRNNRALPIEGGGDVAHE